MSELISVLRVLHIVSAVLMAWPYYALVVVNQRVKLGQPLGDRADTYMENIIKNRTVSCFMFQGTVLISGLALIYLRGQNLGVLISNPAMGLKFLLLLLMAGLLSFVHISMQPRLDALFSQGENPITGDLATQIGAMRLRRKQLASFCMFAAITSAMLGMQVWVPFPLWLSVALVLAIGLFAWRAYRSEVTLGWI